MNVFVFVCVCSLILGTGLKRTQTNVREYRRTQIKANKHKQVFMNINEHNPPLSCTENDEEHEYNNL
ncbi:hypothetical protein HanIR_Chr04g0170531 [Helianthus annuus]|nr:hypothetical protein HanIR_Chr04g0170531 [Helianthus annuus]